MFSIIRFDEIDGVTEWAIRKAWFRKVWYVYVRKSPTTDPVLGGRGFVWRASFSKAADAATWVGHAAGYAGVVSVDVFADR